MVRVSVPSGSGEQSRNGALGVCWKTLESDLAIAREALSEHELRALELRLARELGLFTEHRHIGAPRKPPAVDVTVKAIEFLERGMSERGVADRLKITRHQVRELKKGM